jgi:hypothetical protein
MTACCSLPRWLGVGLAVFMIGAPVGYWFTHGKSVPIEQTSNAAPPVHRRQGPPRQMGR